MNRSSITPPSSRQSTEYWAPFSAILVTSLERIRCRKRSASAPVVRISPMCETSNTPAPVRTATCSWRTPSYCTGISHPAKGTRRAPAASWRSNRGVRRRVSAAGGTGRRVTSAGRSADEAHPCAARALPGGVAHPHGERWRAPACGRAARARAARGRPSWRPAASASECRRSTRLPRASRRRIRLPLSLQRERADRPRPAGGAAAHAHAHVAAAKRALAARRRARVNAQAPRALAPACRAPARGRPGGGGVGHARLQELGAARPRGASTVPGFAELRQVHPATRVLSEAGERCRRDGDRQGRLVRRRRDARSSDFR